MSKLDKSVFYPAYIVLILISGSIILLPDKTSALINTTQQFIINKLGFIYIWYGIFALLFVLWIAISKYGRIKLGEKNEKPEFSTFSWSAMLFCAGIGAGLIYWGAIEWVYYYQSPPFGLAYGSWQAAEQSIAYSLFHWGPVAWSIYSVSACAIAYMYHVRKDPVLKISEACAPVFKYNLPPLMSSIINVAFMFGLLGATATSLGIGAPLATVGIAKVFNVEITVGFELLIIAIITLIFASSAYLGLKKGIKLLSDLNILLTIVLVLVIFLMAKPIYYLELGTTVTGYLIDQFPRMLTWLDPIGQSGFPQNWTVFYWAWWGAYAPFMGMFIAKISRGRTIRNMLLGSIGYGSIGCGVFFVILGGYGMDLHRSGVMNIETLLTEIGGPLTVIKILEQLPVSSLMIFLGALVSIVFMATTFDSASYVLAAVSQKELEQSQDPERWLRLLWAFSLALIPIGFLLMGSPLVVLQTVAIIAALPVSVIVIITAVSFIRMVREDGY